MKRILYVCVHNSGRSQMAEAFTNYLALQRKLPVRGISAGTIAGEKINPVAQEAMLEAGISMEGMRPKQLTEEMANGACRTISMGCGVDAEACPARILITEDWELDDPAGKTLEQVRITRDQIRSRVETLLGEIQKEESDSC